MVKAQPRLDSLVGPHKECELAARSDLPMLQRHRWWALRFQGTEQRLEHQIRESDGVQPDNEPGRHFHWLCLLP